MESLILKPRENLLEWVTSYLIERRRDGDFSAYTVVFPNKRPKHFLLKYLSKNIGKPFLPPKILSIDEFVEVLFRRVCKNHIKLSPVEAVYILHSTMREIDKSAKNQLFSRFEKFFPYGIKLFQAFEELWIESIKPERLTGLSDLISQYVSLSKAYREFYQYLESRGFATRSIMYRTVADKIEPEHLDLVENLILCGFYGLTDSEERLLRKIEKFLRDGQREGEFISVRYDLDESNESQPELNIYECPDRHGQAFILKNLLTQELCSEETVVVLPSEELLFPVIRHGLSSLNQRSFNISLGYPVLRTPIWSLFEAIAELLQSSFTDNRSRRFFPLKEYLDFVLHPYVKNIKFRGDPAKTRILLHSLESSIIEQEIVVSTLEELEGELLKRALDKTREFTEKEIQELREHLSGIHNLLITPFYSIVNLRDFAEKCIDILNFLYRNSTAPFHPLFFPFYSTFLEKLHELTNSLIAQVSFEDLSDYFNFLKSYLRGIRTPFEGVPIQGLQILGFLETRNLRFRNVFFLDLNEELFPPLLEDFILPYRVREALGLPTFEERQRLLEYYFRILIDGAERVFLIYVKDERRERSRFLERIIWEREKRGREIPACFVNYRLNLSAQKPEPVQKSSHHIDLLRKLLYSPSSIDTYIKCPLRFYYSYVLQLEPKEEFDLDSTQIGSIVHSVLSQFFDRFTNGSRITEKELKGEILGKIVESEFRKRFRDFIFGDVFLAKRQILKRLSQLIDRYYREIAQRQSFSVIAVDFPLRFVFEEVTIYGIIDIIEKRDDRIFIVDYKTSGRDDHFRIRIERIKETLEEYQTESGRKEQKFLVHQLEKNLRSIQIPLYVLGYSRIKNFAPEQIQGRYLLLGNMRFDRIEYDPFLGIKEPKEAFEVIESTLRFLIGEILNPQIPFYPTKNFRDNCPYCDFRTVCGTLWVKGRRY